VAQLGFGVAAPGYETDPSIDRDSAELWRGRYLLAPFGDSAERSRDEWIEVHLSELRDGVGHPGNTQQNIFDAYDVAQRRPSMAEEERCAANRAHHLMRVPIGEGQNPEHTISKQFDSSAAAAEHHYWPE
jgi:hypothetical protein